MPKLVLSVDGGGIRGIIPATVLKEIEKRVRRPLSAIFDLMVGSSTGGLLTAGLSKKNSDGKLAYTAQDLIDIYSTRGPKIFESSFLNWRYWRHYVYSSKYSDKPLEEVLDEYFGNTKLSEAATNLILVSYDTVSREPVIFRSFKPKFHEVKMKDALRATTAAPTYFTPKTLVIDKKKKVLIDGGVFSNNPALIAYTAIGRLVRDEAVILSLGTGHSKDPITFDSASSWGILQWAEPIVGLLLSSSLDQTDYHLVDILRENFIRIQIHNFTYASEQMDDASSKNIENLHKEASLVIEEHDKEISKFCKIVEKYK